MPNNIIWNDTCVDCKGYPGGNGSNHLNYGNVGDNTGYCPEGLWGDAQNLSPTSRMFPNSLSTSTDDNYAFEYSPHEKAPIVGGTWRNWGSIGQVGFQFMHFPMSFVNLQSEVLRNSKDALLARQWSNPEMYTPLYFASIYMMAAGLSGLFNRDLTRFVENDTVERFTDFYRVFLSGDKKAKGRGWVGPGVGDLVFLTTLGELYKMPDNEFTRYVVGYNNAYSMTNKEKASRLFSTFPGVQIGKIIERDLPAIANGRATDILKNEFGIYPKPWTKKLQNWMLGTHEKFKGAWKPKKLGWKAAPLKDKTKTEAAAELDRLYRAMGI